MRKLMMFAVATVMATVASAATVKWGGVSNGITNDGTKFTVGTGSETASLAAYYFAMSDYSDVSALVTGNTISRDTVNGLSSVVATAVGQTSTSTAAAGRMGTSTTVGADVPPGTEYFAVVFVTMGGKDYYNITTDGSTATWTTTAAAGATNIQTLTWTAAQSSAVSSNWTAVGSVPEPTSGLLLLVGGALLGLRRKRA